MTGQTPSCSIVIKGPLDASWVDYFGDLVLSAQVHDGEISTTVLSGPIPDLGAFIGLVTRVHNHGLTVLRVNYADYGIDDNFIKQMRDKVSEGTSALFLLTSNVTLDKVVDAVKGMDFEIISTNLSKEQEDQLRAAFSAE